MSKNDIIIPGALYPVAEIRPTLADEIHRRESINKVREKQVALRVPERYDLTWERPELVRFSTGHSLKARGKMRILENLHLIPSQAIRTNSHGDVPQMPMFFPELAGFGEVDVGTLNTTNASTAAPAVSRDIWGNLTNILTKAGETWSTVQTSKYQASAAGSQAEIAKSQEAIARLQTMAGQVRKSAEENWPWILAAAVAGGALLFYMKRKRR